MSPEQARNAREATPRSDLYSVSAILYELLTGRTPYLAESPNDLLFKLFTAEPDPILSVRADLPPDLARLIHQGLSKDPESRPASALEFAELLVPFADARSTEIIARVRAVTGGVPASTLLSGEGRGASLLPSVPSHQGATTMARTALSSGAPTPLAVASPGGLEGPAKIALAVGVLAIAAGSAVLLTRPAPPPPGTGAGLAPSVTAAPAESANVTPSATSSVQQVVLASAPPAVSSAPPPPVSVQVPSTKVGVSGPPGGKSVFGKGLKD
jgi:serine/threonine-protein kinase